eukprot:GHVP01061562.1.p1 GENE.GHVP01061562.1~~GHVP01061562.1.p1  ORF type:complete len:148 (-),score=46.42 GHVP01061562.1:236-679(-)
MDFLKKVCDDVHATTLMQHFPQETGEIDELMFNGRTKKDSGAAEPKQKSGLRQTSKDSASMKKTKQKTISPDCARLSKQSKPGENFLKIQTAKVLLTPRAAVSTDEEKLPLFEILLTPPDEKKEDESDLSQEEKMVEGGESGTGSFS